jgi:uncharacterized protein YlxW (UPF0749 family)
MWLADFSNVLSVLSFIVSLAAALFAARTATAARELRDRAMRYPTSRIESLQESLHSTQEELHNLANRVKMMKVRRAADHIRDDAPVSRDPDPHKEPDRWREWMNSKLARAKIGAS